MDKPIRARFHHLITLVWIWARIKLMRIIYSTSNKAISMICLNKQIIWLFLMLLATLFLKAVKVCILKEVKIQILTLKTNMFKILAISSAQSDLNQSQFPNLRRLPTARSISSMNWTFHKVSWLVQQTIAIKCNSHKLWRRLRQNKIMLLKFHSFNITTTACKRCHSTQVHRLITLTWILRIR